MENITIEKLANEMSKTVLDLMLKRYELNLGATLEVKHKNCELPEYLVETVIRYFNIRVDLSKVIRDLEEFYMKEVEYRTDRKTFKTLSERMIYEAEIIKSWLNNLEVA